MFTELLRQLYAGEMPDIVRLNGLVSAALVKKTAVIKLAPQFWYEDSKMNPVSDHLLWASIVLADKEKFSLVEVIMIEEWRAKGKVEKVIRLESLVEGKLYELLPLIGNHQLRQKIIGNILSTLPVTRYKKIIDRLVG